MRARYRGSVLYAEYVVSKDTGRDAAIRGAHLQDLNQRHAEARKRAWHAMDLLLEGPRRGAPEGDRAAFRTEDAYKAAIHKLYAKADAQGWDLTNESICTPEWIARQLEQIAGDPFSFSERTMERRNQRWGISMSHLRQRRV
jgi:hypothetical protein